VVVTAVDGLTLTVKRLTAAEHAGLAASEAEEAQTIKERDSTKMERPAAEKGAY
jgi:hypothetical protein